MSPPGCELRAERRPPTCWPRPPTPTRPTRSSRRKRRSSNYDPQQIFDFLHTQIGYELVHRLGPRARGTLWSSCRQRARRRQPGRGLDARLGHPGRSSAGQLCRTAGPAIDPLDVSDQLPRWSGSFPPGALTADPANDPKLLSETENSRLVPVRHRQRHAGCRPTHGRRNDRPDVHDRDRDLHEVPDNLRKRRRSSSTRRSTARQAHSSARWRTSTTTVLDQTFNDVDLVGGPLTIGNFVSGSQQGHFTDH